MKVCIAGALSNVILNAALIPSFGMTGAVMASLASQFVMMLGFGWLFHSNIKFMPIWEVTRAAICAAFAYIFTASALHAFPSNNMMPISQLILSVTLFGGCYLISSFVLIWRQLGMFSSKN